MNNTIHKYPLEIAQPTKIHIRKGTQILSIQAQQERPFIFALINPNGEDDLQLRTFISLPVGKPLPASPHIWVYMGTYQLSNGKQVYHVFEEVKQ